MIQQRSDFHIEWDVMQKPKTGSNLSGEFFREARENVERVAYGKKAYKKAENSTMVASGLITAVKIQSQLGNLNGAICTFVTLCRFEDLKVLLMN